MAYCSRCDRHYSSVDSLTRHQNKSLHHNICDGCDIDFPTREGLVEHWVKSREHFYCQRCDKHFEDGDDLEDHYEDDHFFCGKCRKIFDSKKSLKQHNIQTHPSQCKRYCAPCNRAFASKSDLREHLSSVHQPRQYKCPNKRCGATFTSHAALVLHCESGKCPSGAAQDKANKPGMVAVEEGSITMSRTLEGPNKGAMQRVVMEYSWKMKRTSIACA